MHILMNVVLFYEIRDLMIQKLRKKGCARAKRMPTSRINYQSENVISSAESQSFRESFAIPLSLHSGHSLTG